MQTKKMSVTSWVNWKENRPELVALMPKVIIKSNQTNFFRKVTTVLGKQAAVTPLNQKYGSDIGKIFDWLDDNCKSPYYVEFNDPINKRRNMYHGIPNELVFYFMDEGDAVSFKFTFLDDTRK